MSIEAEREEGRVSAWGDGGARWPLFVVIGIALLALGRAAGNDWAHYDDDLFLFRNPHYNPPTFASLTFYWSHSFRGLWTPLTHTAWWLVAKIALLDVAEPDGIRLNPWMFHAANVLLHAIASALVFVLLRRALRATWPAIVGAIVFAAHPVQVEAVAWVCGTKDVLAALFTFVALIAATTSSRRWSILVAIGAAALAMLSKPSAAMLPVLLAIYAWMLADAMPIRRTWLLIAATTLLAIPITLLARSVQDVADVPAIALAARPLVALDALTMHLSHIVWPARLCADYGLTPAQLLLSTRRWYTWTIPLAAGLALWRVRDRWLIAGALLAIIALVPNLGLSAFQFQVYSTVADRYDYAALFGIALLIARLAQRLESRATSSPKIVAAVLIVALVPLSFARCGDWRDAGAVWSRVLDVNPSSSLAHNNLGAALAARGDLPNAIAHFEAAASNAGSADGFAYLNLAQLHLRQRQPGPAADAVVELVKIYRTRSEHDADLEHQTVDRFAAEIRRLDPATADTLLNRIAALPPVRR